MPQPRAAPIDALRTGLTQVRNRLQQIDARAAREVRKRDTRRKIILGGLLLEAAGKERRFAEALDELSRLISRSTLLRSR
ncbi:mobilization protein [Methylobacterium terrae]|uniref:Mobilization protein n=1 Tax=Methylobacterium terrae TaxID=2202827 RepID=A0A2U8WXJ4_9HYPH|nr:mobilization protein [Methylobacterium terrae]